MLCTHTKLKSWICSSILVGIFFFTVSDFLRTDRRQEYHATKVGRVISQTDPPSKQRLDKDLNQEMLHLSSNSVPKNIETDCEKSMKSVQDFNPSAELTAIQNQQTVFGENFEKLDLSGQNQLQLPDGKVVDSTEYEQSKELSIQRLEESETVGAINIED